MTVNDQPGGITTLFLDIGGVLLTNGWGHESRALAVDKFKLDGELMETRHRMAFDTHEMDKMSLDEYLELVVFYEARDFSKEDFKAFMFQQSQALAGNIDFFKTVKSRYRLKVIAVSNEGRELNEYRIQKFELDSLFDVYISSCYVHLHKPDEQMLQMACDISHTRKDQALYIDDQLVLVDVAKNFGLQAHQFTSLESARAYLDNCTFSNTPKERNNAAETI